MRAAAWFLILFGLCYTASGVWMLGHYQQIRDTWPAVTAVSDGSRVVSGRRKQKTTYSAEYDLRYRVDSRDYVTPGTRRGWSSSRLRAEETAAAFAPGTQHTVWYDPSNPYNLRDDVGSARLFFLPALFGGLGVLMLGIGAFLYRRPVKQKNCPSCGRRSEAPFCGYCGRAQRENKARPPTARDRQGSLIVGGVFAVLGVAMLGGSAWWMYRQFYVFENWPETTATVLDRQFDRRNITGKLSFESRIRFEYQVGDLTMRNAAEPERSSAYGWIRQRFDRYEPGSRHPIRYDPANPSRIRTHTKPDLDLFLPFLILGAMGIIFAALGRFLLAPALKTQRVCTSCEQQIAQNHRYCPWCGAPAS